MATAAYREGYMFNDFMGLVIGCQADGGGAGLLREILAWTSGHGDIPQTALSFCVMNGW